jgi:hypothetical protein
LAGKYCIVKYFKSGKDKESPDKEARLWNEIWSDVTGTTSWTTQVKGREHVLVMPYVRTLEDRVGAYEGQVREAVLHMAKKGYRHMDLCSSRSGSKLHHVGVRMVDGVLKAVLVDLTEVEEFDKDDPEKVALAEGTMLEELGLQGP